MPLARAIVPGARAVNAASSPASSRQPSSKFGGIKHYRHRLDGRFDERVMQIEAFRLRADGMTHQRANTHLARQPDRAQYRIL